MNYLLCILDGKKDYTPISDEQETKISKLINAKKLPPKIRIGNKEIISDTILGFTQQKVDAAPEPEVNYQAFRDSVENSAWYRRLKGKSSEEPSSNASPAPESSASDAPLPRGVQKLSQIPRLANRH